MAVRLLSGPFIGSASRAFAALLITACGDSFGTLPLPPPPPAPPIVTGRVYAYQQYDTTPPGSPTFGPGDTVRFQVEVHARRQLTWLGFALGGTASVRDSIAVPTTIDSTLATLVKSLFPPGTRGLFTVTAFARDNAGDYGEAVLAGNPLSVYDTVTAAVTSASFDGNCSVIVPTYAAPFVGCDLAVDPTRNLVYISEPDSSRIAVLSLATMAYGAPIIAPDTVSGLDLTPGGDSLVVALPTAGRLGIVDLTTAPPTWHLVNLTVDTLPGRKPAGVRVAASEQALVSLTTQNVYQSPPPPVDSTQLIEYDVKTGSAHARYDVWPGGGLTGGLSLFTPLTRSADASRIVLSWATLGYQVYQVYDAPHDSLLPIRSFPIGGNPAISVSANGHRVLIKGVLFDETARQLANLDPPGEAWVSALSPGGDTAYFGFGTGFLRTRLADGATFQKVLLPDAPVRIDVLPGGARLLIRGQFQSSSWAAPLYLVDLNSIPSSPVTRVSTALEAVSSSFHTPP